MSGCYPLHPTFDKWNYDKLLKAQDLIREVTTDCIHNNGDDHSEDVAYQTYLHLASELIGRCYTEPKKVGIPT